MAAVDPAATLPEAADVFWRPRVDRRLLDRRGFAWQVTMIACVVPFIAVGVLLIALEPWTFPVALIGLAHAWAIPELYANRGANVVKPRRRRPNAQGPQADAVAEETALGLLGDLVAHDARELHARTGLILERGALGVWLVGPYGALLLDRGGRRVHCWCVHVADPELPTADRVSHLLLALRVDEQGFATVANLAFTGARWRIRRRLVPAQRPALDAARAAARAASA